MHSLFGFGCRWSRESLDELVEACGTDRVVVFVARRFSDDVPRAILGLIPNVIDLAVVMERRLS